MKKLVTLCLLAVLCLSTFVGCGSSNSNTKVSDLGGTWKQVNSNSSDSYQEATISGTTIEIYWVSNGGETKSLYWAGTYVAPSEAVDTYSWSSVNDHEKTKNAMFASNDDTKTIGYEDGQLYWETSAIGTTTTVKLEKVK